MGGYEVPKDLIDKLDIDNDYTPDEDDLHHLNKEIMNKLSIYDK